MAYYSYNAINKQLLAISDENLSVPENGVVVSTELTATQLRFDYTWDLETTSFIVKPQPRLMSKLDYLNRFTDSELASIYTAAKTNVVIEIWLEKFRMSSEISLDDPRTIAGINSLEQSGLITASRAAEILG